ncbi:MAG: DUF4194 domain-containing protein [Pseudomonadales bacterium]|nr:DUF4194 domain-containing protein [Pseudomonadales bacterium]
MMMSEYLLETLKPLNISTDEFSELVIRLLDYGVINRDESQVETTLYDRYMQCADTVHEYLSVLKVTLQHDARFCFVRAYPPGAVVPGLPSEDDAAFSGGFRVRPTQQEVAVILVLRVEYEKSLREGKVDEKGCVLISMEALVIALNNLLKRTLPDNLTERKTIFKHLRQLRLIKLKSEADLESEDGWLSIQPAITSFVSDDVLNSLYPDENKSAAESDMAYFSDVKVAGQD